MTVQPEPKRSLRHTLRRRLLQVLGVLVLLALVVVGALVAEAWRAMGARSEGARLARLERSPQYRAGHFRNELPRVDHIDLALLMEYVGREHGRPEAALPVQERSADEFSEAPEELRVTWLGHSTLLIELQGARVLIDPVWGERASPSSYVGPSRFYPPPLPLEALPEVDAVLISHDHYDHLDLPTVDALKERVPRWIVPLGVGAHLESWGVPLERITELDWWEQQEVAGLTLVCTPSRHFSGRSALDADATLWSGWAILGRERRVYYSGDTAMSPDFTEIGTRLGPFDLTLIESGAYDAAWADVHLGPEQALEAHRMVRGELFMPVHWSLFDLALHSWTEPAERVRAAAEEAGIAVAYPRPGESFGLEGYPREPWWPAVPWETAAEAPVISSGLRERVE